MSREEIRELLRTGIQAARSGNPAVARGILEQVVRQDPSNELAWLWLASVAPSAPERQAHLQRVLQINPDNRRAKQALAKLERAAAAPPERPARAAPPPPTPSRPPAPRRTSTLVYVLLTAIALVLVGVVAVLAWNMLSEEDDAPPTADVQQPAPPTQAAAPATPPPAAAAIVPTPSVEPVTIPPRWTQAPSATPYPTVTPSPPPAPLASYGLLVTGQRDDQAGGLYTMDAAGENEQGITLELVSPGDQIDTGIALLDVYDASFSPDGSQLVFTATLREVSLQPGAAQVREYDDIFLAPAEGGPFRRVVARAGGSAQDPVWSPDGTQIAYASDVDGDYDIYVVSANGGIPQRVTDNNATDWQPTWSPDGDQIAFASDYQSTTPGLMEIWRVGVDGGDLTQLTNATNSSFSPAWSPSPATAPELDGELIAFISDRDGDADLYVMYADGRSRPRLLTLNEDGAGAEERDPAWSDDGRWIAFSSTRSSPQYDIYVIHPNGRNLKRVTVERGNNRYVDWK